ncbi:MAG: ACT domain-containing protein [Bacteroidota bacterium]
MESGETNLNTLLRNISPKINPGEYVFCVVQKFDIKLIEQALFHFRESEGITIIIEKERADELGIKYETIFAWITLEVHSSLDAVGLTASFSQILAVNKISCNVVAGYYHDHLFVRLEEAEHATSLLDSLSSLS